MVMWSLCLSGMITTTVSFDRERQREFMLSVTATDQAEEPLIGICPITVVIADQNDNDPKFENSRYQCEFALRMSLQVCPKCYNQCVCVCVCVCVCETVVLQLLL